MLTNAQAMDMTCADEAHVHGCPCHAGGDPIYRTYPPCFICKGETDSMSVRVSVGLLVETVCDTCYERGNEGVEVGLDYTEYES